LLTSQRPNLLRLTVQQRIATACRASFSRSDAADVSKVGASLLYAGTFAQLTNSKTKIFLHDVLTAGIKTYFFGVEAIEICHGELSPIERMELDEEELREFGLDEEGENEE
jgi:hypothetical protein